MFEPGAPPPGKSGAYDEGCSGCSFAWSRHRPPRALHARDTSLVLVSAHHVAKIGPFKARMGWTVPWYSSFGSDFNYDFHATTDRSRRSGRNATARTEATLERKDQTYHLYICYFLRFVGVYLNARVTCNNAARAPFRGAATSLDS